MISFLEMPTLQTGSFKHASAAKASCDLTLRKFEVEASKSADAHSRRNAQSHVHCVLVESAFLVPSGFQECCRQSLYVR